MLANDFADRAVRAGPGGLRRIGFQLQAGELEVALGHGYRPLVDAGPKVGHHDLVGAARAALALGRTCLGDEQVRRAGLQVDEHAVLVVGRIAISRRALPIDGGAVLDLRDVRRRCRQLEVDGPVHGLACRKRHLPDRASDGHADLLARAWAGGRDIAPPGQQRVLELEWTDIGGGAIVDDADQERAQLAGLANLERPGSSGQVAGKTGQLDERQFGFIDGYRRRE